MVDFVEKYPNLYESVKNIPKRRLKIHPSEDRGDDCGSSLLPEYENTTLTLFLTSQKIAYNGFIENYCLDDEITKKIRSIRKKVNDNPFLKESINDVLSQYLPISLEAFQKLVLGDQLRVIDKIKYKQLEDNSFALEEKIEQLINSDIKVKSLKNNKRI